MFSIIPWTLKSAPASSEPISSDSYPGSSLFLLTQPYPPDARRTLCLPHSETFQGCRCPGVKAKLCGLSSGAAAAACCTNMHDSPNEAPARPRQSGSTLYWPLESPRSPGGPWTQAEKKPTSPQEVFPDCTRTQQPLSLGTCRHRLGMAHLPVHCFLGSHLWLTVIPYVSPTPTPWRHSSTKDLLGKVNEVSFQRPPQVTREG